MKRRAIFIGMALLCAISMPAFSETGKEKSEKDFPKLTATLVDAEAKALKHWATVKVDVKDFELKDSAEVKEQPHKGQGHIHYRVDDGPVIATTAKKLSFHDLTSGEHTFLVELVGNDHKPIGVKQTLNLKI